MVQGSPFERDFDGEMARLFTPPFAVFTSPPHMADLFCGIGGASVAAANLGLPVDWAAEPDNLARFVYEDNTELSPHAEIRGDAVAHAPPFSILYAALRDLPDGVDALTTPSAPFPRIVQMLRKGRPPGVVVEAPAGIGAVANGRVLAGIVAALDGLGYVADHRRLDAALFPGTHPAAGWLSDERVYVVCVRAGKTFTWPETSADVDSGALLSPPLAGVSAEEMLRLYGFPAEWRLTGHGGDAERFLKFASPVPVAQALLSALIVALT